MDDIYGIEITTRDKLLRAWENTTGLVRDFQNYAREIKDDKKVSELFSEFAEDEGIHASKLFEILHEYENKQQTD